MQEKSTGFKNNFFVIEKAFLSHRLGSFFYCARLGQGGFKSENLCREAKQTLKVNKQETI
jgi:hypothetical protein